MKSIFDITSKNSILQRIEKLSPTSQRLWGKMDVAQMLAHCANGLDLATGKIKPPRQTIGLLFGWVFKSAYYNTKNFPKNIQTIKGGKVEDKKDFNQEKQRLINNLENMHTMGEAGCTQHPHPIMGSYTPAQWGMGMYKHLDHHLRQFGV